jgi:lipopolysaccharide export system protein LptA
MKKSRYSLIIFLSLLIFQTPVLFAQKNSKIEIKRADFLRKDKNIKEGASRLIGNVRFWQDSTIMECDSAHFMGEKNWFEAYGNVHLYRQGTSKLDVKSDFLKYNGNTKMANFRKNVVLRDTQVVLFTDSLDYDIHRDIGYYLDNGRIVDSATTLISKKGYYYHKKSAIFFKERVEVNNNQGEYQMYTDTLKYDTQSKITYFFGPTEFYNDSNYMFAEFGWYNTQKNEAFFKKNALYTNPSQSIEADSLFYDRALEHGIAYSNVIATDSVENIVVKGNYLEVFKKLESFFVTDSALLMGVLEKDTVYLHADTIYVHYDSTQTYRLFKAFHHTKIFKSNFQAKTDSLYFSLADSIIRFYGSPILWAEQNQIVSDYIEAYVVNEKLDRFKLFNSGMISSIQDSTNFNQIKGAEMTGYFKNNQLTKIDVFKGSETIYFPSDEFGIIGVNKSASSDITLLFKKNKINRIIYRSGYEGAMHPLGELPASELKLKNFVWYGNWRPNNPMDIFIWEGNTPVKVKEVKKEKKKIVSREEE